MTPLKVINPYSNKVIDELEKHSIADVQQTIQAAYCTFHDRKQELPIYQRIHILETLIKIMQDQKESLIKLATMEGGKPFMDSKVEISRAIHSIKVAIQSISQMHGQQIPMGLTESSCHRIAFTQKEPIGVVASISAFNHPLNLTVHQTIPAIAVGAPVIIKPALTTPLSCLRFVNMLYEAGLPKSWCQAVLCDDTEAQALACDPHVHYLSFIGSAKIGWMLRSKIAPGTRCNLEHGGVAPVIIDKLNHHSNQNEAMFDAILKGGFYHAGQVCVSVQRVFIHTDDCDTISQQLTEKAQQFIVGDPLDPKTQVGPLIRPQEVDRIHNWVEEAKQKGASILCGGHRLDNHCYAPTIILDPPQNCLLSQEEIFGPVICLYTYKNLTEAIEQANALPYTFQAAVFTEKLDIALNVSNQLNASCVMINDHTAFRVDWMPFSGRDKSGLGTGGIPYMMHEITQEKMIVIKHNQL